MMAHLKPNLVMDPLRPIQCLEISLDSSEKKSSFHIESRPPEFPADGLASHATSSSPHIDFIIIESKFSIFVSCRRTRTG